MPYAPNYSADPGDADLTAFLAAAGLDTAQIAAFNLGFAKGAVTRFERATGRMPFLATASQDYLFDPPGVGSQMSYNILKGGSRLMQLTPPFTTVTAIAIGVTPDSPSGTPIEIGRQCYLRPNNAAALGLPIEAIEFLPTYFGTRQSVKITGTAGSFSAWPVDAWNAVLMGAAADLSAVVGASISGGLTSIAEADVNETYQTNPMSGFESSWRARFNSIVAAYKVMRLL